MKKYPFSLDAKYFHVYFFPSSYYEGIHMMNTLTRLILGSVILKRGMYKQQNSFIAKQIHKNIYLYIKTLKT